MRAGQELWDKGSLVAHQLGHLLPVAAAAPENLEIRMERRKAETE